MTERRRYRVISAIGRGGFGTVYKAELLGEGGFSKLVALKVLNPDKEGVVETAQRLRDEARILGLVRHRAIVQADSLVRLDGRWAVVMEFVEGADLDRVLESAGTVPTNVSLAIVGEVAAALHAAATQPGPTGPLALIHRDIKPSNIQQTAGGETKLLDFGIARANFASREAKTRAMGYGTLAYMSPERLDFEDGPKGDVYALGAVLFELLLGEGLGRTWAHEERHATRLKEADGKLSAANVPPAVAGLVLRMLAFEPASRPDAREVVGLCESLSSSGGVRQWSERVIPALIAAQLPLEDDLNGRTLEEGSGGFEREPGGDHTFALDAGEPGRAPVQSTNVAVGVPMLAAPRVSASAPLSPSGTASTSIERPAPTLSLPNPGPTPTLARERPAEKSGAGWLILGLGVGGLGVVGAGLALALGAAAWLGQPDAAVPVVAAPEPAVANPVAVAAPSPPAARPLAAPTETANPAAPVAAPVAATLAPPPEIPPTTTVVPAPVAAAPPPVEAPTPVALAPPTPATLEPTATPDAASGFGTVTFTGNKVTAVYLFAGAKRIPAGRVPIGTYTIEASFDGKTPVAAGTLRVVAGQTINLQCNIMFEKCTVK